MKAAEELPAKGRVGLRRTSLRCLTAGRKSYILAGSVIDGQNSPEAQEGKELVDAVLDEVLKVPHNSASLLLRTQRFDSAAKANEFASSLKINSR